MNHHNDIEAMRLQIGTHVREIAQRPIKPVMLAQAFMSLTITGGQALVSSQIGIKNVATLATVSSLWDPDAGGTYEDGIGTAILYSDGASLGNVLVVNDGRAGLLESLVETWRVRTAVSVLIPWITDPTQFVTAYIPTGA